MHETASDQRYYDSLKRGEREATGTGTSVTPLLSGDKIVTYRVYDGVHELYWGDHDEAVEISRRRRANLGDER